MPSNQYQKVFIGYGFNVSSVQNMIKQYNSRIVVLEAEKSLYNTRTSSIAYYLVDNNGYTCIWMKKVKRKRYPEKVLKIVLVPESESTEKPEENSVSFRSKFWSGVPDTFKHEELKK